MEDNKRLRRSEFFPNLGLMFTRESYNTVWKGQRLDSTTNGWDHWLRLRIQSLHGECVYPVMPRIRHLRTSNSSTVSFSMSIKLQRYPLVAEDHVDLGDVSYMLAANYDKSILFSILQPSSLPEVFSNMNMDLLSLLVSGKDALSLMKTTPPRLKKDVMVFVDKKDDLRKIKMYSNRVIVAYVLYEVVVGMSIISCRIFTNCCTHSVSFRPIGASIKAS